MVNFLVVTVVNFLIDTTTRECAIELSTLIETDDNLTGSVNEQLMAFLQLLNDGQAECSEKAYRWLRLFNNSDEKNAYSSIKRMRIRINYERTGIYDKLIVKSHESRIYLCSSDYNIKVLIRAEAQDKYMYLLGIQGIFFGKATNDLWELQSQNPYVQVV